MSTLMASLCVYCPGHYTTYALVNKPPLSEQEASPSSISTQGSLEESLSPSDCSSSSDEQKEWMHFSDECVRPVTLAQVLHRQAYILFYDRIS